MPYRVEVSPVAARELRRLPPQVRVRLEPTILALAQEPRPYGTRKIRGIEQAHRIRVGEYRIVYDIYDEGRLVVILHVGRRTEGTYRGI